MKHTFIYNQEEKDMIFDEFIRTKVQSFIADPKGGIEPSDDFISKVMTNCISSEKQHANITSIFIIILALLPFASRQFWMLIRNDYFSVGSMPLNSIISSTYHFIISPIAFYTFLGLALGTVTTVCIKRWRTIPFSITRERQA